MQPFDIAEVVDLDQFLVDHHPQDETITVPANWLHKQLTSIIKLKRTNTELQKQQEVNNKYLTMLQNRVDALLLSSELQQSKRVHKYLDVHS